MGGLGSGRHGSRSVVERASRIDVGVFDRRGAFDGLALGSFEWSDIEGIVFEFLSGPGGLFLVSPVEIKLPVVDRTTATGGEYRLWACPHCQAARRHLYFALLSDTLACRTCLNLTYRRSNVSGTRVGLAHWKVQDAARRLEELDDADSAPNSRRGRRREETRRRWLVELAVAEAELHEHVNIDYRTFRLKLESSSSWKERNPWSPPSFLSPRGQPVSVWDPGFSPLQDPRLRAVYPDDTTWRDLWGTVA